MRRIFTSIIAASICCCALAVKSDILYLSGRGCDDTCTWGFTVSDGLRKGQKATIEVPSCWEQQGFGNYTYGRWYTVKGAAPSTEQGLYTYTFTVPKDWHDKVVDLVFEGVMTDATVWINGIQAGPKHQGAFTTFSYDISDKLRYGKKNHIKVEVLKESSDKSINAAERKADWWLFGGIYRPVYLKASPKHHITHASIDAQADGTVNAQLFTHAEEGSKVRLSIDGLGQYSADLSGDSCIVSVRFDNPKLWDTEHPHLYDLTIQLLSPTGEIEHSISKRIGFRTIEFRYQDGFYLNGTKLLIKGVNRHCCYPQSGRTTSAALDYADVKMIKGMNANAIRSHYPPDGHLLDICDSLGVLYLDELAGWQNAYSDTIGARILREMVMHDASHPCIFAWSNGNEGGFNYTLDSLFADYDPQNRHVVHAWALWDGVDAHHYPAYQTGVGRLRSGSQVFMPTEFLHAQYDKGGGASLSDFWHNWCESPLFAGGFIWSWADEGIARSDRAGEIDTDGPNAPDGIVGPYREKEGSWYAIRDVWSPLQIDPVKVNKKWDRKIIVRNGQLFSDLSECRLICNDKEIALPHAEPGEAVKIEIPVDINSTDILRIVALNHDNDTINVWSWPTISAKEYYHKLSSSRQPAQAKLKAVFDDQTGMLTKVIYGEHEIPFNNGPIPVGFDMKFLRGYHTTDGTDEIFVAKYSGGVDSIVWRVTPDGMLGMEAVIFNDKRGHGYDGNFVNEGARSFGFSFSYPENECSGLTWMGRGPYRVWRNRQQGQTFGIWHKDYNNTVTGELQPGESRLVYPEFKGYHGDIYYAAIESEASPLTIYTETDGLYLRLFTPQEPRMRRDGKNTMEAFPPGDISFLIDIAPIQSYKPLQQLGPAAMSQTVRINKGDDGLHLKLWLRVYPVTTQS